jgi:hypothetical protein
MDRLEEQIRQKREQLDRHTPPADIWEKIRKKLKKGKPVSQRWISIAAMIVVILGTAIILFSPAHLLSGPDNKENTDRLTQNDPQLRETEVYYNSLVHSLYNEAAPLLTNNPDIKKELNYDMSHLDSICADLKKDLKDNISNKDVVEALIQNYRIKIQILEDMVAVLKENQHKPEKKKSHEL